MAKTEKTKQTGYASVDMPHAAAASYFERNPFIPDVDIITLLKLLSRKNRGNPAIDCNNIHATYQELIDDSKIVSKAFRAIDIKKGDIITVSLPSNYQAVVVFLALNSLGAVTTFIDNYAKEEEILSYLRKYNSPVFINYASTFEDNQRIIRRTKVKKIITLDKRFSETRDLHMNVPEKGGTINFNSLGIVAESCRKKHIQLMNRGNDNALILYTSGSTGQPKAVVLTNRNVIAAQVYAGKTSHTENITGTKTMTCVPLRYPYGMVTSLLTSLLWGKETIMTPDWDSSTVDYYFRKQPNIIFGSPAVLSLTLRFLPIGHDLSHVSHFISGGDFLTIEHAKRAYEFFAKHNNTTVELGNGCGNAETVSIGSTPVGVPLKQSTAGKILVGTTPLVIDADTSDKEPISNAEDLSERKYYEIGELCLSGEYIFKEYYGEPEATKKAKFVRNGKTFFRTGTLGFIDEDGYFTPTDRKSRFYIRSTGHKVYLDRVQQLVCMADERIVDCAAVHYPDEKELFICKVFVVLSSEISDLCAFKEELLKKLNRPIKHGDKIEQLKEYEIPKIIEFIDVLPRIYGSGKIDYQALNDM